MKHSIVLVFISLAVYVLMASAAQQLPADTWTNPYFFYHYNAPLAMAPQKISPYAPPSPPAYSAPSYSPPTQSYSPPSPSSNPMAGNQNIFSNHDDHSIANTLGSHVVMLTCLRELRTTKADLAQTTQRLDQTHTDVEHVKNELKGTAQHLTNVMTTVETMKKEMNGNAQHLTNVVTTVETMKKEMKANAATNIGRMPKSCNDLQTMGHRKGGFFMVMGNKTIDNVYCDFAKPINDPGFQKVIGYVNVKTSPVYFHAQKNRPNLNANTIVPFEILRLNIGNAMSTSGLFVAPKSGKYFFAYSGISEHHSYARVELQVKTSETANWTKVGQAHGQSGHETYTLQATFDLAEGNQIRLLLAEGQLHDNNSNQYTSFVGHILEEDIIQ